MNEEDNSTLQQEPGQDQIDRESLAKRFGSISLFEYRDAIRNRYYSALAKVFVALPIGIGTIAVAQNVAEGALQSAQASLQRGDTNWQTLMNVVISTALDVYAFRKTQT